MILNVIIVRLSFFLYMSYSFIQTEDYLTDRNLWWLKIAYPYLLSGLNYYNQQLAGSIGIFILSFMILIKEFF